MHLWLIFFCRLTKSVLDYVVLNAGALVICVGEAVLLSKVGFKHVGVSNVALVSVFVISSCISLILRYVLLSHKRVGISPIFNLINNNQRRQLSIIPCMSLKRKCLFGLDSHANTVEQTLLDHSLANIHEIQLIKSIIVALGQLVLILLGLNG